MLPYIVGLLFCFQMIGHFLDNWTTSVGMDNKLQEVNSIWKKILPKYKGLVLFSAGFIIPAIFTVLLKDNLAWAIPMLGGYGAAGWYCGIKNYRLIKRLKIPFSFWKW
jgi:hypothetical protein